MKINGLLQNYSCLITSGIDNSFIIPPPLPSSAPHFKQSHRFFFTCLSAELEADKVHHVDSPGGRPCQSPHCDLQSARGGHATRPFRLHVKQLGKKLPLHPSLIGKTSSSPAESSLTYYPDYCLTWGLSHYLRHVSLSCSPLSLTLLLYLFLLSTILLLHSEITLCFSTSGLSF